MYTNATRVVLLLLASSTLIMLGPSISAAKDDAVRSEVSQTRQGLIDFVQFFSNRIERACAEISRGTDEMRIKHNTVFFKMRIIPLARRTLELADDQAALMDLWLYSEMMMRFVDSPMGRDFFGPGSTLMTSAAEQLESTARGLARGMLEPEQFEAARDGIRQFLDGRDVTWSIMAEEATQTEWTNVVTSTLDKPIDVVSASIGALTFGGGLSDTAVAVHRAANEAERAVTLAGYLPTDVRWQTELLLLEVREYLDLPTVVDSARKVGDSSAAFVEIAKTLPRDVRRELVTMLDEVDDRRPGLQSTLTDVNAVLLSADRAAQALQGTSVALTETLGALDSTMLTILGPPEEPGQTSSGVDGSPSDEAPFDINEYTAAVSEVSDAALALQALLVEVQGTVDSPGGRALIDRAEGVLQGMVTRLYVGAGLLVLFTAAVMVLYRAAIERLGLQQGRPVG